MVIVDLIYGFSFLAAGLLLALQARLSSGLLPKGAVWWVAVFALTHGLSECLRIPMIVPGAARPTMDLVAVGLGALSFLFLVQFGVEFYGRRRHWSWLWRALPALLLSSFILLVIVALVASKDGAALRSIEAASRYAFGLPGSLLAAAALWSLHRERRAKGVVGVRYLAGASAAFAAYAIFAGALPSAAPHFPASRLNAEAFHAITHVPIELLRTACAVAIAVLLSEAFVIRAAREREEWERRREEFIAVIAHDLRNPLAAIAAGGGVLEKMLGNSGEMDRQLTREVVQTIRRSAHRLDRMIRDLLDSSRIEARALAVETCDVELRALVEEIVDRASRLINGHRVRLLLPDSLPSVSVDPERIEQVLENLLSNAVKYGAPDTEITIGATVHSDEVELAVTNLGQGLSPEDASNVFARFYRSKANARRAEGLGLGLYIAKGLVVAQGGRMWLDTKLGEYATFRFTVPRSKPIASRDLTLQRQPSTP